jgi:hypothetical protein
MAVAFTAAEPASCNARSDPRQDLPKALKTMAGNHDREHYHEEVQERELSRRRRHRLVRYRAADS